MKLSRIVKLVMAIFTVIAAGGAGSFILINKIEANSKKIYESRSMLKILENRDENYALLKADYPVVRDGMPLLRRALPGEDSLDEVVTSLDALANETNNTQNLVFDNIGLAENIGGMKIINFSASLDGNFGSFENYFKEMQKLPYYIEVGNISINNGAGVFNNNSHLNFKAKLYIKS